MKQSAVSKQTKTFIGPARTFEVAKDWEAVKELLKPVHGSGSMAAVIPNATMQYFEK